MFYTTDISVTIWIFNKNKKARMVNKNGKDIEYRDRTNEILFMDLRQKGHPFEKKYIEFTHDDMNEFAETYHNWISKKDYEKYENIKEYCASVNKNELKDYSLVPSQYIEFDRNEEEFDYDIKMKNIQSNLKNLYEEEEKSHKEILKVLEDLGYGI